MRKSIKPKSRQNLEDVEAIFDDFIRFSNMSFQELQAYADEHPYQLDWLELGPISMASNGRFWALTDRELESHPERGDLDRSTLNQAIRRQFEEMIQVARVIDQPFVDRMLARAIKRSREQHKSKTYYLPCVLVGDRDPREFKIGPVRFIHRDKFFSDYAETIERDLAEQAAERRAEAKNFAAEKKYPTLPSDEEWDRREQMTFDSVTGYYKGHRWVAEVTIPPCDERVSRRRAELIVQAALDILKIFLGSGRGKGLRLATEPGVPEKHADLRRDENGRFEWTLHYGGEWALVEDGWFDQINDIYAAELNAAGQAIETYLHGREPTELATRWLDALHWYGQGVSERNTSAQIVKYVAALERLSITRKRDDGLLSDTVSRRTALFATRGDREALPTELSEARKLYDWRSSFMHGRSSPVAKDQLRSRQIKSAMHRAEDLLRSALFGALAVYGQLILNGKSTGKHLEQRLHELEVVFGLVKPAGFIGRLLALTSRSWRRLLKRDRPRSTANNTRRSGSQ